ncbi:hypothetical protein D9758_000771 [Tetrapyrgos nigripes]|uniref:Uncharacterized protein n=1 Tax=Tetrapyrgos nigripes TaxID=182062 RepID=A0A8H5LYD4_9AGAR|nr:hypothetical protein D9758_000771 [Tetrapyrgos nigripes]
MQHASWAYNNIDFRAVFIFSKSSLSPSLCPTMLLKFTNSDMFNTSLIDIATGAIAYDVVTCIVDTPDTADLPEVALPFGIISPSLIASNHDHPTFANFSIRSDGNMKPIPNFTPSGEARKTEIRTGDGALVAEMKWDGRRPDIFVRDEHVGQVSSLFDLSNVKRGSDVLAISTRFSKEYEWNATANCVTLVNSTSGQTKGVFHQNTIRVPVSPSSASNISRHDKLINTRVPGLGHCYLEFESHPLVEDVEIIISFFIMEILRRGRFSLTPYMFERPRLWQLHEAKDMILRRLRRNTVS